MPGRRLGPEVGQQCRELFRALYPPQMRPVRGEQPAVAAGSVPAVDEQHEPAVCFRTDNTAGSLKDLVHAGILIGVFKTHTHCVFVVIPQGILFYANLRQAHADDDAANKTVACKINTLGKNAAKHAEAHKRSGPVG